MWVGAIASAFFLVSIAFERYLAVHRPLTWNARITKQKVTIIAVVCWCLSFCWVSPTMTMIDYNKAKDYCVWVMPTEVLHKTYIIGCVVVIGVFPICLMCFLYSRVIYTLWIKHNMEDIGDMQLAVFKARQKSTKIVITVTALYCFCWIPHLVTLTKSTLAPAEDLASMVYHISVILVTLNSSLNPLIYTLQSRAFRKNIAHAFGFKTSQPRSGSTRVPPR